VLQAAWIIAATVALPAATRTQPAEAAWPDDRPLTRFVQNLGRDLSDLPSADSAVVLGVGGSASLAAHPVDDNLRDWAADRGESEYTSIGRTIGDGWIQAAGAIGTYAAGRLARHAPTAHIGSDLIRAQALNGVLTTAIKYAVDRSRPSGGHHAFPSGHASASFASAAVLAGHFGWRAGVPAYAVAGFVGWTRIRDRAHWLSDVVFGAAIGTTAGLTVTRGHRPRTVTVVPTRTPGGAALYVVLDLSRQR
jgi:membrane-associated phospholipid phosphatase